MLKNVNIDQKKVAFTVQPKDGRLVSIEIDLQNGVVDISGSPCVQVTEKFNLRGNPEKPETLIAYVHADGNRHQIAPAMRVQITKGVNGSSNDPLLPMPQIHALVDCADEREMVNSRDKVVFVACGGKPVHKIVMDEWPVSTERTTAPPADEPVPA